MTTRVASVNLRFTLSGAAFGSGLREVLRDKPDLVALQEAGKNRDGIIEKVARDLGYEWARPDSPNGDPTMPVMWRAVRYRLRSCRAVRLARREFVGHLIGRKSRLPASWCTEAVLDELDADGHLNGQQSVIEDYHLTADIQDMKHGGRYKREIKYQLRVARHRREKRRLGKRARWHKRRGRNVKAVGDGNFHGMTLGGFVSCWEGRDGGTLGNRAVDIVFADRKATRLWTVETPSDHDALVVTY